MAACLRLLVAAGEGAILAEWPALGRRMAVGGEWRQLSPTGITAGPRLSL